MKLPFYVIIFVFLIIGFSCAKLPDESTLVHLKPTTFSEEILEDGIVEAVNSVTITGPSMYSGTVIVYLVEEGSQVQKGDTVCIVENKNIENNYDIMVTRIENTKVKYTTTKANLELNYAMLKAELENIDAQTAITNLDSAQMNYLSPVQRKIKELELKQAKIRREKIQKKFDYLKPINEAELRGISLQIKRDSIQSLRYKDMLDEFIIISPSNGMVMRERSPTSSDGSKVKEGDNSYYGYPILSIPDMSSVKVEIMVSEADYRRISVGDSVVYTFDAMPGNFAWGKVSAIAPMGKPIERNSKVKEFTITASVDSFNVIPEPGLSANCRIVLKEVPDTIVVPQLAIFEEDSTKVVYALDGHKFERREVLLGEASLKEAVVIAGLNGNETLSFVKPSVSRMKENVMLADSIKTNLSQPKTDSKSPADVSNVKNKLLKL